MVQEQAADDSVVPTTGIGCCATPGDNEAMAE
jgi:hypothetical protein